MTELTHLDESGKARLVDISEKNASYRVAVASVSVVFPAGVYQTLRQQNGQVAKGSIIDVANIAGTMAAKKTSDLIPLCHPMQLEKCRLSFEYDDLACCLNIEAEVAIHHKTGVEMEALTAASVAALTVYDMTKALSHDIAITDLQLQSKTGGKRHFNRS